MGTAGRRPAAGIRGDLAENPAVDATHLRALATDVSPDVRRSLAHNPRVPLDLLASLAGTATIGATLLPRIAAATPAEVESLAKSPDPAVRMLLAARRDLPPGTRDALAADTDAKVLKSIAPSPRPLRGQAARHDRPSRSTGAGQGGGDEPGRVARSLLERVPRHKTHRSRRRSGKMIYGTATRQQALLACLAAAGPDRMPPAAQPSSCPYRSSSNCSATPRAAWRRRPRPTRHCRRP